MLCENTKQNLSSNAAFDDHINCIKICRIGLRKLQAYWEGIRVQAPNPVAWKISECNFCVWQSAK